MSPSSLFALAAIAVTLPAAAYAAWNTRPATLLTAGIGLTVFSGHWGSFGLPELVAPDRLLIAAGVVTLLARAPQSRDRPAIQLRPVHWLLAATLAYVFASAIWTGSATDQDALLRLTDRLGATAFLLFVLAPAAYVTDRDRDELLAVFVVLGLYLSITAVLEVTDATGAILPRYIADPAQGIHFGRARGPFLEAVGNGTALFFAGAAAAVARTRWRGPFARTAASLTMAACGGALLLTLTRSVWLGALIALPLTVLGVRELRRYAVEVVAVAALIGVVLVVTIPGLSDEVQNRRSQQSTVWDRYNLDRAAWRMLEARPLAGHGWDSFKTVGSEYFVLAPDYPLTAGRGFGVHSAYFSHLSELGLVGTSLWLLCWALCLGGAIGRRGPPDLRPWKIGLFAMLAFWCIVANFIYPYAFSVLVLWTWAGIAGATPGAPLARQAIERS